MRAVMCARLFVRTCVCFPLWVCVCVFDWRPSQAEGICFDVVKNVSRINRANNAKGSGKLAAGNYFSSQIGIWIIKGIIHYTQGTYVSCPLRISLAISRWGGAENYSDLHLIGIESKIFQPHLESLSTPAHTRTCIWRWVDDYRVQNGLK